MKLLLLTAIILGFTVDLVNCQLWKGDEEWKGDLVNSTYFETIPEGKSDRNTFGYR